MEALILIPIIAIIYAWMQTIPAGMVSPSVENGFDNGGIHVANGFCSDYIENNDQLFTNNDSDLFNSDSMQSCNGGLSFSPFADDNLINVSTIGSDLMFDPINSWCSFNIYHHDDHISGSMNSCSDPFSDITDSIFMTSFSD